VEGALKKKLHKKIKTKKNHRCLLTPPINCTRDLKLQTQRGAREVTFFGELKKQQQKKTTTTSSREMKRKIPDADAQGDAKRRGRDSQQQQQGELRVYLGNLSFKVDEEAIRGAFGGCGKVRQVDFITDYRTGQFYGTAFVQFETAEAARRALALNGQKLLGRPMKVEAPKPPAKPDRVEKVPGCRSVFVSRLPREVEEDALVAEFGKAGPVAGVRWVEPPADAPVCCGFVEYEDEDAAVRAVGMFHGTTVLGAHGHLRVNLAPDRPLKPKPAMAASSFGEGGDGDGEEGEAAPVIPKPSAPAVIIKAAATTTGGAPRKTF
jgi:hypothetical protein